MKKTYLIFFLLAAGCSTYSKKECETFNWKEVGYEVGRDGNPGYSERLEHFKSKCGEEHAVNPDSAQIAEGYKMGLDFFCSPQGARRAGSMGLKYYQICPAEKEEVFLKEYKAERFQWLESEVRKLNALIYEKDRRISSLESEVSSLRSSLDSERSRSCR